MQWAMPTLHDGKVTQWHDNEWCAVSRGRRSLGWALGGWGDDHKKWLIYDLVEQIQRRSGNERQTTWIMCLFRLLRAARSHERTEQHANLICFWLGKIVRTARTAPVASPLLFVHPRTHAQYRYIAGTTDTRHRTPDRHSHCLRQLLNDTPSGHHVFLLHHLL